MSTVDQDETVIYRTPSGKAVYANLDHPAHDLLNENDLQNIMFHFYEVMVPARQEMLKQLAGSSEYMIANQKFRKYENLHLHFARLWRKSLSKSKRKTRE